MRLFFDAIFFGFLYWLLIQPIMRDVNEILNAVTGDPKESQRLIKKAKFNWGFRSSFIDSHKQAVLMALRQQKTAPRRRAVKLVNPE
jgi:predicted secreted protein